MTGSGDGAPPGRGRPTRPTCASTDLLALALWCCWSEWLLAWHQPAPLDAQCGAHFFCFLTVLLCCALVWRAALAQDPPSTFYPRPTPAAVAYAPPHLSTHASCPIPQHSQVTDSALQEAHVQWQLQEAVRASPALLAALLLFAVFPVNKTAGARRAQRHRPRPLLRPSRHFHHHHHHHHRGRGRRRELRRRSQRRRHKPRAWLLLAPCTGSSAARPPGTGTTAQARNGLRTYAGPGFLPTLDLPTSAPHRRRPQRHPLPLPRPRSRE